MQLIIRKIGNIFIPSEKFSKQIFDSLQDGIYKTKVTKARLHSTPEEVRRAAQNSLYWDVLTDLQNTEVNEIAGTTKEDWHEYFKERYLINIFIRDDKKLIDGEIVFTGYALMFSTLETVLKNCGENIYANLYQGILDETTTTRATVKQFSEYLESIIRWSHERGVVLKIDDATYKLACGYQERPKRGKANDPN